MNQNGRKGSNAVSTLMHLPCLNSYMNNSNHALVAIKLEVSSGMPLPPPPPAPPPLQKRKKKKRTSFWIYDWQERIKYEELTHVVFIHI